MNDRQSAILYRRWVHDAGARVRGEPQLKQSAPNKTILRNLEHRSRVGVGETAEEVVPLRLLRLSSMSQMKQLYGLWRKVPSVIEHYLLAFIFPAHMHHQQQKVNFITFIKPNKTRAP